MKICYKCKKDKSPEEFGTDNSKKSKKTSICKSCKRIENKEFHYKHRLEISKRAKERRTESKREVERKYKKSHQENYRQYHRKFYKTEKGQMILERVRVSNIRKQILEKLGGKCVTCGFSDWRALQIDHKYGGGGKEIKNFNGNYRTYCKNVLADNTDKYQLLCANCNWIKRYENKECKNDKYTT